ncbi:MAG: hypothetical protein LHV69_09235 [Elusimicrobia bacterium]|nr:hypothetical protein [Candidatus Obscuribacterium magneticum]
MATDNTQYNYASRILIKIVLVVGVLIAIYYSLPIPYKALVQSFWSYVRS